MKLFISWSGERSQALAHALREWLPMVLHYTAPWLSHSDIEAGQRWAVEIARELEASKFGIICLTRENIGSPWILFEAGALTKVMREGRVIPLLLDLDFKEIAGPLAQFQAKKVTRAGLRDVVWAINEVSEMQIPEHRLGALFDSLWPACATKVSEISKTQTVRREPRPQSDILEELVSSIRGLDLRLRESAEDGPRRRHTRSRVYPVILMRMAQEARLGRSDPLPILMFVSLLRDEFPWLYELGLDAYRASLEANSSVAREAHRRFSAALALLERDDFLSEFLDELGEHEIYMLLREIEPLVQLSLRRDERKSRTKRETVPALSTTGEADPMGPRNAHDAPTELPSTVSDTASGASQDSIPSAESRGDSKANRD